MLKVEPEATIRDLQRQLRNKAAALKRAAKSKQTAIKSLIESHNRRYRIIEVLHAIEEGDEPVAAYLASRVISRYPNDPSIKNTFVTSLPQPPTPRIGQAKAWRGGRVCGVDMINAGRLIVGRSHRLSTPREIARWRAQYEPKQAARAAC